MMEPAFSSPRQAAGFALMLLAVLLSPLLMGKSLLPPRAETYSSATVNTGPYASLWHEIYAEKEPVDIAFIGSSHMWLGVDTPYVQDQLGKALGRKAVVRTLGWPWAGYDAVYFIARDLIENRKVRMIVIGDEHRWNDEKHRWEDLPHHAAEYWFRYGDDPDALDGLPLKIRASYYFAAILGMPHNLVSLLRPNIPDELLTPDNDLYTKYYRADNPALTLGSLSSRGMVDPGAPFVAFTPHGDARPSDVHVYSDATKGDFKFLNTPPPGWELHFAKKLADLAKARGVKLVYLHIQPPASGESPDEPLICERTFWPDVFGADLTMIGIAPARFFAGLSDQDRDKLLSFLPFHANQNGQQYFTRLITPALLQVYEDNIHP